MTINKLEKVLRSKRGYLKKSALNISQRFQVPLEEVQELLINLRKELLYNKPIEKTAPVSEEVLLNAWNYKENRLMSIDEYCDTYGFDRDSILHYTSVTHTKVPYYNIKFKEIKLELDLDDLKETFTDFIKSKPGINKKTTVESLKDVSVADRLVYTDVHIGMEPNPDNKGIYKFKWDEEELYKAADLMIKTTLEKQTSNILIIDDLGDLPDGLGGKTTRGGHGLPQNMTDLEVFKLGVAFKIYLVEKLKPYYKFIYCNNVCEDNHGGVFTAMINTAFKGIIDVKYSDVLVTNYEEFFGHYFIGEHCKILCHGKDSKELKFGMGTKPSPDVLARIEQYIEHHDIYRRAKHIEFSKGDSHQCVFDLASSDKFNYMSYPALCPSSKWIQLNFKKGRRGFVVENISNSGHIQPTVIWIK